MSKKVNLLTALFLIVIAVVLTFSVTYSALYARYQLRDKEEQLSEDSEDSFDALSEKAAYLDQLYRSYYVGELDSEQISEYLARGYIAGTGDRYAAYLTKEEMEKTLNDTAGTMVGVGVHVIYDYESARIQIISVIPDSPAEAAGMLPGDVITQIDGVAVNTIDYNTAVGMVQGEEGTNVSLTVLRNGTETLNFDLTRATVNNVSVTWRMYDDQVGIVRLYLFSENTGDLVRQAVEQLKEQGAQKLIFDVRSNSGGELNGIVNTLDYLLPEGPILHIQDKDGNTVKEYTSDAACVDMPMVVLVNGTTASAAELFAAGLQDYGVATIVGEQTFGKGTVCSIIKLPDGSGISMSTQYYTPPYSDNIEGKGVLPDIVSAMDLSKLFQVSDDQDTQLQAGLQALQ